MKDIVRTKLCSVCTLVSACFFLSWPAHAGDGDCSDYPLIIEPDPAAREAAELDLAAWAPEAELTWDEERGTLSIVRGLNIELPQCIGDVRALSIMDDILAQYPALFQIDRSKWRNSIDRRCSSITEFGSSAIIHRSRFGPHKMWRGLISFRLVREGDSVFLSSLGGSYIPEPSEELLTRMAACGNLNSDYARKIVMGSALPYTHLTISCTMGEVLTYQPTELDVFKLDETEWSYSENSVLDIVVLKKRQRANLVIDPSNVTDELWQSNANCSGQARDNVGFVLMLDTVLEHLSWSSPGIDCTTC